MNQSIATLVVRDKEHSLEDPIHQGFARGRASWDVDIHWYNAIAASGDTVAPMVIAPAVGTGAHTDNPPGVRHLIVDLSKSWSHLVREGASNNHNIGLSRRSPEDYTETVLVITRGGEVHHLDSAAGESECHGPQGTLTGPIGDLIQGRPNKVNQRHDPIAPGAEVVTRHIASPPPSSLDSAKGPLVLVCR